MKRNDLMLLIVANVITTVAATVILNFIYKNRKPQ